ncbi:protein SIEVE ELEMENT OCCLUSION C isoform X1 [Beta vulgaris subsp. vulgaris]|uniref:protein SIEVE ELEMENT OCCLUSION C isoform X1 n=1 Tax=Beta vulgaris subsp. vulgaris TaxID=3555 RepID=UPI002036CB67|nr:protein SIEVE ELEMENT OCCLUSION C isoform X1 [Beta vulgaris subsp. vulgaris]
MGCKILLSTTPNLTFCFLLFSTKQSSNSTTTSKSFYTILCDSTQHISCSHWQMALNYLSDESFHIDSLSSSSEPDILIIKSILIMHDPDGRELDCEILLRVIEIIMHQATASASQVFVQQQDIFDMSSTVEESQDLLEDSIYVIISKILCKCYGDENLHESTLSVLGILESYRWDAKLLLALSAFATVFGEFWVIMQSWRQIPLAASIALLKQFPNSFNILEPIFIALTSLVKTMVKIIRSISQFEDLPITHVELQDDTVVTTKSLVYIAAYWIIRSIMVCIPLITNLRAIKDEQERYSVTSAVWEIASLNIKIGSIGTQLKTQIDVCQQQTEQKMHLKLVNLFQEPQFDNQDALRTLFGLRNDWPLKQSNEQPKVGIDSLKNKIVILLISKPEILPVDELLLLVQQTYDHLLHNKLNRSYDILWIPISNSKNWSNNEVTLFNLFSNSLPWYSIRQPWSLSSTTINYAKKEWKFNGNPIMVVLDPTGTVTNINAVDMVRIWGTEAYPFSASREEELWKKQRWNLRLLLDSIDPLLTKWVEEGRTICIYGGNKIECVRKFSAEIKGIQSLGAQLEVLYVGKKHLKVPASNIVCAIENDKLSHYISLTKIPYFWERLESIRRSKLRLKQTAETDHILSKVITLLDDDLDEDWIIVGKGSSTNTVKLDGDEWANFLSKEQVWKKFLPEIGLIDAIRLSLEPPLTEPCSHSRISRYEKELMEEAVICEMCKRPMEKFIIYDVV